MKKAETEPLKVGFIATDGFSSALLGPALSEVESALRSSFPEFAWVCELNQMEVHGQEPLKTLPLFDEAYLVMLENGWDFCFLVTEKRLAPNESPSGWMKVSLSHSAAVLSLYRLRASAGEVTRVVPVFLNLFMEAFGRLNGAKKSGEEAFTGREPRRYSPREKEDMARRFRELARVVPRGRLGGASRFFYYLWVAVRHPLWLTRATLSHRPWTVVYRSTRLLFAALATAVISLATVEFWNLGMEQSVWRTSLLGMGLVLLATLFVVWKHHLLAHGGKWEMKEQVVIFKLSTVLTILISFASLFLVLFLASLSLTIAVFPRTLVGKWLGLSGEEIGIGVYIKVALTGSCLALAVGALGAGLEESQDFRYLIYGSQN